MMYCFVIGTDGKQYSAVYFAFQQTTNRRQNGLTDAGMYIINTATFNSGHDKSPEFDYPYLWDYNGIHDIYWLGFVQRIHPPNFTPVGVIPVKILHLKSQNPMGFC